MTGEELKARTLEGFERMFNQGDLDYVDDAVAPNAVDHQEPDGTDFAAHLKTVISTLRTAFPDLRFDAHELVCEGETVACRSTMSGTHNGPLRIGPMAGLPVNGAQVEVAHMHFLLRRGRASHRPLACVEHARTRPPARRARPGLEHSRIAGRLGGAAGGSINASAMRTQLTRRPVAALAFLAMCALVAAGAGASHAETRSPGTNCGGTLWRLMTLSDDDRNAVNLHGQLTTIAKIAALKTPAGSSCRRTAGRRHSCWCQARLISFVMAIFSEATIHAACAARPVWSRPR